MIAANKRLIKANLQQGVLGIQGNLINLYSYNLSTVGTQAALVVGFAFNALVFTWPNAYTDDSTGQRTNTALAYLFYISFTVSFIAALFVLSQATIVITFGPTLALKGTSAESVQIAASHMREQQIFIYKLACISITALFLGAIFLSWLLYSKGIAVITTFLYLVGYGFIVKEGTAAYATFVLGEGGVELNNVVETGEGASSSSSISGGQQGKGYSILSSRGDQGTYAQEDSNLVEARDSVKLKARGILWLRQPIEKGGLFFKCYAVMERGRLDFFRNEQVGLL
jgi:hypothetical protein